MGNPRPGRRPITDETRDDVRRLHAEGLSRNAIARQLHRSGHTVSRIAEDLGLSFDRGNDPQLQRATEARKADARTRRTRLAVALLEDAERLRLQLFAPCTVHSFGGKDNTYNTARVEQPPFRDQRDIMHAVGLAIDRAVRLDEYDSGATLAGTVSLLQALGRGLTAAYGTGDDEHPDTPAAGDQ